MKEIDEFSRNGVITGSSLDTTKSSGGASGGFGGSSGGSSGGFGSSTSTASPSSGNALSANKFGAPSNAPAPARAPGSGAGQFNPPAGGAGAAALSQFKAQQQKKYAPESQGGIGGKKD